MRRIRLLKEDAACTNPPLFMFTKEQRAQPRLPAEGNVDHSDAMHGDAHSAAPEAQSSDYPESSGSMAKTASIIHYESLYSLAEKIIERRNSERQRMLLKRITG
ncbi:MAG TPA: hypothetical protein VJI75_04770 [Candidatus Nanoarchaeia archaeon]|nr:hypothetical protein [Candidatus Nanoarchaeia archaeon]